MTSHRMDNKKEVTSIGACLGDNWGDRRDPPPFHIVGYIEQWRGRLHDRHFYAMRLAGDGHEIRDVRTGRLRDIAKGLLKKRWWHCEDTKRLIRYATIRRRTLHTLYVSWFNKIGFERRLGERIPWLESVLGLDWPRDSTEANGFSHPYDWIQFFSNWNYWLDLEDFENLMCVHSRAVLIGWRNVEDFAVPPLTLL